MTTCFVKRRLRRCSKPLLQHHCEGVTALSSSRRPSEIGLKLWEQKLPRLTILNQPDDFKRLTASLASCSLPVRGAFEANRTTTVP